MKKSTKMFLDSIKEDFSNFDVRNGFVPYLGDIDVEEETPKSILQKIFESGERTGIIKGMRIKEVEIQKALGLQIPE